MKKLIYLITFLISISASAQWIDASNTTVVGVVEDSISNPVDFIVLDSENKFRKVSKDSLGGSFETAANGGIYRAGRDEDYYGDIGFDAFDASFSDKNSSIYGATGDYSTAFGETTIASGHYSAAFGIGTIASGEVSTAFGYETEASGHYSTAFGETTIASGHYSAAFGIGTIASGDYSAAFGFLIEALNDYSVSMGRYNDMSLTPNALFQVGNGVNDSNKNNAYTLNTDATSYQDNIAFYNDDYSANYTDRSLVDKGYVDSEINDSGFINLQEAQSEISDSLSVVDLQRVIDNGGGYVYGEFPSGSYIEDDGGGFYIAAGSGSGIVDIRKSGYGRLRFSDNGTIFTDTQQKGIEYSGDYSANYTDRSLVDKGYVDSEIAGVSGTVESVSLSAPTGFDISGSPVTTTGTLTFDYSSGYQAYTTTEANKLSGIEAGAEVNVNADWNATSGDAEILNKPAETAFSVYNQYSEVTVSTTTQTSIITADTGAESIAVMTEGASYIGSVFGMYNHSADNQNINIRLGIGNRADIINETVNTVAYTGDIPVKIDYTINFFDDNWARVTMFIQVADITTVVVGENALVISIGNELDLDVVLTAGTLTTYSSYLHKHVQ